MDAKRTYENTFLLCEKLIQSKTSDLSREGLYERVKLFFVQHKIGEFHKDLYIQSIEKLSYHRSYHKKLGKYHVADVIHEAFESTPGNISTWSDYPGRFSFEPDGQLQNEFVDNNRTLSMEDFCSDRFRKTVNVSIFYEDSGGYVQQSNDTVREFHLHLSYSKLQNTTTTTAYLYT